MIETSVIALHFCQYICTCSIEILVEKYLQCTKVLYFIRTQLWHNSLRRKCLVQKLIEIIFQSEKVISPAYLKTDILTSIHFFCRRIPDFSTSMACASVLRSDPLLMDQIVFICVSTSFNLIYIYT